MFKVISYIFYLLLIIVLLLATGIFALIDAFDK